MKGGLIVIALYLETGVGLLAHTKNWQRLLNVSETFNYFGKPFVIGGDINNSPEALGQTGWPAGMQGRIVNSTAGTCRSRLGNWSTIDYIVVSRHLLPAVRSTEMVGSELPRPHVPIRLILDEKPRQYRERVLKRIQQKSRFHTLRIFAATALLEYGGGLGGAFWKCKA